MWVPDGAIRGPGRRITTSYRPNRRAARQASGRGAGARGRPPLEQHMHDEGATMSGIGLLDPGDGGLGTVDCREHVRFVEPGVKRVVRPLPCLLQGDERVGKALYFGWKPLHRLSVPASALCASMLQGAVCLMPCLAAASADEQVGRRAGQAVEQGVVRGADGAAQVRLRGPPRIALRQAASRGHRVARGQGASRPGPRMARFYTPATGGRPSPPLPHPNRRRARTRSAPPRRRGRPASRAAGLPRPPLPCGRGVTDAGGRACGPAPAPAFPRLVRVSSRPPLPPPPSFSRPNQSPPSA